MWWGGLGSIVGVSGVHAHVILVLHKCIWNVPVVLLVLPTFDDIGSLGSPPHQVVYSPGSIVAPWVTASHFLVGNRETELKPITSSLLLFLSFLFCSPP